MLDAPLERWNERINVKIADFGLAKAQEGTQDNMTGLMGTYVRLNLFKIISKHRYYVALDGT